MAGVQRRYLYTGKQRPYLFKKKQKTGVYGSPIFLKRFSGRVEHGLEQSIVYVSKKVFSFLLWIQEHIQSMVHKKDSVVVFWKTKPVHGRVVLGMHGSKKGYEIW